jgi:hypothetical protein
LPAANSTWSASVAEKQLALLSKSLKARGSRMPDLAFSSFNPARFVDILKEDDYRVWTSGVALRKERRDLIGWLRKKYQPSKRAKIWRTSWIIASPKPAASPQPVPSARPQPRTW